MKIKDFYGEGKIALSGLYDQMEAKAILKRLVAFLLNVEESELLSKQETELGIENTQELRKALELLQKGIPLQYILGQSHFYGLDLYVEQGVLIPRQETEELVEWILNDEKGVGKILDIGVGSGAITVALGANMSSTSFTVIDNSPVALDIARENCDKYGLRPTFFYGDVLSWEDLGLVDSYDVIVSNPPYVTEDEKKLMHKNVLDYEPHNALFVPNEDPLIFYEQIAQLGQKHLRKDGCLYFEINEAFGQEMIALLEKYDYTEIQFRKDINGKDRMIRGKKK